MVLVLHTKQLRYTAQSNFVTRHRAGGVVTFTYLLCMSFPPPLWPLPPSPIGPEKAAGSRFPSSSRLPRLCGPRRFLPRSFSEPRGMLSAPRTQVVRGWGWGDKLSRADSLLIKRIFRVTLLSSCQPSTLSVPQKWVAKLVRRLWFVVPREGGRGLDHSSGDRCDMRPRL